MRKPLYKFSLDNIPPERLFEIFGNVGRQTESLWDITYTHSARGRPDGRHETSGVIAQGQIYRVEQIGVPVIVASNNGSDPSGEVRFHRLELGDHVIDDRADRKEFERYIEEVSKALKMESGVKEVKV